MENQSPKTGQTPVAELDEVPGTGEIQGTLELKTALVKMRDGRDGKTIVKIAFVVPGGEVYFLDDVAARMKPAQQWAKRQIMKKLGMLE